MFYWHSGGREPIEATMALGHAIREITELGGIVVAPLPDPDSGGQPWFLTGGPDGNKRMDDLILADEILACAIQEVGVDLKHIHALGMSEGGLHTSQMSYRRSNYLASVAIYSGGFIQDGLTMQEPKNQMAAMIFHGGKEDVEALKFQESSERYLGTIRKDGNFGFICNHDRGHRIPRDATSQVWKFFQDHPFNLRPKPYQGALPKDFPEYCKLP